MEKIKYATNVAETSSIALELISIYNSRMLGDSLIDNRFAIIKNNSNELVIMTNNSWANTTLLADDEFRDNDDRALFGYIDTMTKRRPSPEQAIALKVKTVLDKYKLKIIRLPYAEQSAMNKAMISDVRACLQINDLVVLPDLNMLINNCEESQNSFDASFSIAREVLVERNNKMTASQLASAIRDIVNDDIVPYVETMKQIDAARYTEFADNIKAAIQKTNQRVDERIAALARKHVSEKTTGK